MSDLRRSEYRDRIADEAAEWFVRLQDTEAAAGDRAAFAEWLSASAEHVHEYLALAALHADINEIPAARTAEDLVRLAGSPQDGNVVALKRSVAGSPDPRAPDDAATFGARGWSKYPALAAGIAVLALGCALWLRAGSNDTAYTTVIGEQKSFALPDGSVITLNAVSTVQVRYTDQHRDIELKSGEALFNVAKEAHRPFRVLTDDSVIQAVGTRFNVRRRHENTTVTVIEGRVKVSSSSVPASGVPVGAGQRAHVDAPGVIEVSAADTAANTAWRERRLIFESRPLREVVAEFNLYNDAPIEIRDPGLDEILVSGSFYANDPRSFALFLEEAKLARPQIESAGVRLLRFAAPGSSP